MPLYQWTTHRRRPSILLDAGYVALTSIETSELNGKKLICFMLIIFVLVVISLVNFFCLLWVMHKLDWNLYLRHRPGVFRFDRTAEFDHRAIFTDWILTKSIENRSSIDFISDKQIDLYGEQNGILIDDDQIHFNTDRFSWKNRTATKSFFDLHAFRFHRNYPTRVHLTQIHSQHIHHRHLHLRSMKSFSTSNSNEALFNAPQILLESFRSELRFRSSREFRLKTDSLYLYLRPFSLLGNQSRHGMNIYRLCLCNKTRALQRVFAHQPCPRC